MAPADHRQAAIDALTSIGIGNLIGDSAMPREHFDSWVRSKRPGEGWADLPALSIDEFDDELLSSLFHLTQMRKDYANVKGELTQAVNFRLSTKGQPHRKIIQLLHFDVKRVITLHSAEVFKKRLNGELPTKPSLKPGLMERALQRMGLELDSQTAGPGISVAERPTNGDGRNTLNNEEMQIEEHGADVLEQTGKQPGHNQEYSDLLGTEMDTAEDTLGVFKPEQPDIEQGSFSFVDAGLPIIYPLRIFGEDDNPTAATRSDAPHGFPTLPPRSRKEALFIPIDADEATADTSYLELDNFASLLCTLDEDKKACRYQMPVTNEKEHALGELVQIGDTTVRVRLNQGLDMLPSGAIKEEDSGVVAAMKYRRSNMTRQRHRLAEDAQSQYENLQKMSGLVLSLDMKALFTNVFPPLEVSATNPDDDGIATSTNGDDPAANPKCDDTATHPDGDDYAE